MYKLNIISGPNRGSSFAISDGENSIGRQAGNAVVLSSQKVSKRHCVLVVNNEKIELRDEGSSNGTFVNGVLSKIKSITVGDRISVGEFVLELVKPSTHASAPPALAGLQPSPGNVVPIRGVQNPALRSSGGGGGGGGGLTGVNLQAGAKPSGPPKELLPKLLWHFEQGVMPTFYSMMLKKEWRLVSMGLFGVFAAIAVVTSVYPLLEASRGMVIKETQRRAVFMAKQIVERNSAAMASKAETKTDIGTIDRADGVRLALLVDLNSRIVAPASRLNEYLTNGYEATFAVSAAKRFREGKDAGFVKTFSGDVVIAVEPVMVLDPQLGRNVAVGMAVVSLDASIATLDAGEMGVVYSEAFIITGIIGALIMFILYRLTLKPFETLNEDMDKVLKGDMHQVSRHFKFEEMQPLWDIINSVLQRAAKASPESVGNSGAEVSVEDFAGPLRAIGKTSKNAMVVCDESRRVVFLNEAFEEMTGIRADNAIGQELVSVARDQGFAAFANDVFDRVPSGGEGLSEDYDFSGMGYRVYVSAFGTPGEPPKCLVMTAVRNSE
jgi:PAS domain S-box-containing protein